MAAGFVRQVTRLRAATLGDADAVAALYSPYVTDSIVSFETEAPDAAEMRARIMSGGDVYPWIVAQDEETIVGYAYACAFRTRLAYRFSVETTVYVAAHAQGHGIGRQIYGALLATLTAQGFAQAVAAITLPNPASVKLHEDMGFAPAGTYRQIGYKLGGWHDVGLWQRALAPAAVSPAEPLSLAQTGLKLL